MGSKIDEDLYSRQLGTFGISTMKNLLNLKVAIHGMRGVGSEAAKNLILAGPAKVSIFDQGNVDIRDLGANCFLRLEDVGRRNRAEASVGGLRNLNSYVEVEVMPGFDIRDLDEFNVIVLTDSDPTQLETLNSYCRTSHKGFISAESWGAAGYLFIDFGPGFQMTNRSGQDPSVFVIDRVDEYGTITFLGDKGHDLRTGDTIMIEGLRGAEELNDKEWTVTDVPDAQSVEIGLTGDISAYISGGLAKEVKKPESIVFRSWSENAVKPEFAPSAYFLDKSPSGKTRQLHLAGLALREFQRAHGRLPKCLCEEDAQECLSIAKRINEENSQVETITEEYSVLLAKYAELQTSPFATFWGGILAQEVVKFTGSYRPINQFIYNDWFSLLTASATRTVTDDRYSDQSALFGTECTEKLKKMNLFLVGAGALGCEYVKGLALMGGGCGTGQVHVTDDDHIELSNLSRQFLFHREHIGKSKSEVASLAAKDMNSALNVHPHQERVCDQTEELYNDQFWEIQDVVLSAVDNIKARHYLDAQCLWFSIPFLESGTKGLSGSSMVILPDLTKSYSDLGLTDDKQAVANCTLKRFPYQVDHCVEWARNMFEFYFTEGPREAGKFLLAQGEYLKTIAEQMNLRDQRLRLEQIRTVVMCAQNRTFAYCVQLAREIFDTQLHNEICQLLHALPPGYKTPDGREFWTSPKRIPHPLHFDPSNDSILDLVVAAANLYAEIVGIPQVRDREVVRRLAEETKEIPFEPICVVLDTNEKNPVAESYGDDELFVRKVRGEEYKAEVIPKQIAFEKDDDTNFHIDFIHSLGSLRSENYDIPSVTKLKSKLIAGKIIPAVTTSGAAITGAMLIELYKVVLGLGKDDFRGWYFDLGTNYYVVTKPSPPVPIEVTQGQPEPAFTSWSKLTFSSPLTLSDFITSIETSQKVHIVMASCGDAIFYGLSTPSEAELASPLEDVIVAGIKKEIPGYKSHVKIDVFCKDSEGNEAKVPTIKYILSRNR